MDSGVDPKLSETKWQPEILDLDQEPDRRRVSELRKNHEVYEIVDSLAEAIEDLFKIDFPFVAPGSPEYKQTLTRYKNRYIGEREFDTVGLWVYFPWRWTLVHLPDPSDYFKLRTARNKFLITLEEQEKFYQSRIGIAGLSVGSSVVNGLILTGGGGKMRIADLDTLSITNLNRLSASVTDLAQKKSIMTARRVYEMNPYQELEVFSEGLTEANMKKFFVSGEGKGEKLQLFIEEMDNIKLKIESRFMARALRIPVVMATDNGDNTIIDVERFDLEPERLLFHGRVSEDRLRNLPSNPTMAEKVKLANRIVGPDVVPRMQLSLTQVGTKLPTWPQLGTAATLSGATVAYVARRILAGLSMPSGRYEIHFDAEFDPEYMTKAAKLARSRQKAEFIESTDLLFGKD